MASVMDAGPVVTVTGPFPDTETTFRSIPCGKSLGTTPAAMTLPCFRADSCSVAASKVSVD